MGEDAVGEGVGGGWRSRGKTLVTGLEAFLWEGGERCAGVCLSPNPLIHFHLTFAIPIIFSYAHILISWFYPISAGGASRTIPEDIDMHFPPK